MNHHYNQQLLYVFNRPVEPPAWYWQPREEEDPFGEEEDPLTAFLFYENLCKQPGTDLAPYSDAQVGLGLTYLFDGAVCNLTHGFKAAPVDSERKVTALRALATLFKEVFTPRCSPVLAACSQEKSSPLSYICYMFWDVTPLSGYWSDASKIERRAYYEAVAWVMEQCLASRNPAVVESGLHGLGHMAFEYPAIAVPIIDNYLNINNKRQDALANYARAARTGMIL